MEFYGYSDAQKSVRPYRPQIDDRALAPSRGNALAPMLVKIRRSRQPSNPQPATAIVHIKTNALSAESSPHGSFANGAATGTPLSLLRQRSEIRAGSRTTFVPLRACGKSFKPGSRGRAKRYLRRQCKRFAPIIGLMTHAATLGNRQRTPPRTTVAASGSAALRLF